MGQDVIDQAATVANLEARDSKTAELQLHGAQKMNESNPLSVYGSDANEVRTLAAENATFGHPLHSRLPYIGAEVIWAARNEMARTVEDVLARRTRALLLDARASIEMAPAVANLLASELERGDRWAEEQVREYSALAQGYLLA
jgi:glycerol-3-phosphate dehydrogenase